MEGQENEKSTHRTKTSLKRETCTKTCRQGFIINRSIPKWRGLWQSSAGSSPWPALFHTWVLIPCRTAFIKQAARKQNSKALWAGSSSWLHLTNNQSGCRLWGIPMGHKMSQTQQCHTGEENPRECRWDLEQEHRLLHTSSLFWATHLGDLCTILRERDEPKHRKRDRSKRWEGIGA